MNKLLSTTALVLSLTFSGMAHAAPDGDKPHGARFMEEAISKLPPQKAEAFRNTLKQAHEKGKESREQSKKLHEELRAIMTAEKFDKSAYLAKTEELRVLREKKYKAKSAALATALSALTQEERTTIADNMRKKHERHGKKIDGDDKPAGDAQ